MKKWQKILFTLVCVIAIEKGAVIATWHKAGEKENNKGGMILWKKQKN